LLWKLPRQGHYRHFLEVNLGPRMILQANEAWVRPWPSIRIMSTRRFRRLCLSLSEVRDSYGVEVHDCLRSINGGVHRVPFADWFDRARQSFCKCVEHTRARIVVGPVADFDLIASVDCIGCGLCSSFAKSTRWNPDFPAPNLVYDVSMQRVACQPTKGPPNCTR
jgi:hypothetical protein